MKETEQKITNSNASDLSNDGLLAVMASLAQNLMSEKSVKERLREQILAGDLQKKAAYLVDRVSTVPAHKCLLLVPSVGIHSVPQT